MSIGKIITFYSFKGGVGRSMALANTAVVLAGNGQKVCVIDWDLEAPGIDKYFAGFTRTSPMHETGLLGLLGKQDANWQNYAIDLTVFGERLTAISAGCHEDATEKYTKRLQSLNWDEFYNNGGGAFLERFSEALRQEFDFILIDSRTGLTDAGGICTIQLPDILVTVFTANSQSIEGAKSWADRSKRLRQYLPYTKTDLTIIPLVSRWDGAEEQSESEIWFQVILDSMGEYTSKWASKNISKEKIFEQLRIPHVPFFSFGEKLAVTDHSVTDPALPGRAYVRLAALLAIVDWDKSEILANEFATEIGSLRQRARKFRNARRQGSFRVYISAASGDLASYRQEIARVLRRKGIEVRDQEHFRQGGALLLETLNEYIKECDVVICLIGDQFGSLPTDEHMVVMEDGEWTSQFRKVSGQRVVSYTQWEVLLAKGQNKPIYAYLTDEGFVADNSAIQSEVHQKLQSSYRDWVKKAVTNWTSLTTISKLIEDVLVLPFPDLLQDKLNNLPLMSLGSLSMKISCI